MPRAACRSRSADGSVTWVRRPRTGRETAVTHSHRRSFRTSRKWALTWENPGDAGFWEFVLVPSHGRGGGFDTLIANGESPLVKGVLRRIAAARPWSTGRRSDHGWTTNVCRKLRALPRGGCAHRLRPVPVDLTAGRRPKSLDRHPASAVARHPHRRVARPGRRGQVVGVASIEAFGLQCRLARAA